MKDRMILLPGITSRKKLDNALGLGEERPTITVKGKKAAY
jgi:hypothetical protein